MILSKLKWMNLLPVATCLLLSGVVHAKEQAIGDPPEAKNMQLVGWNDLQQRSAYQPTVFHQGNRWIAYIGHHGGTETAPRPINPLTGQAEYNGTSIVDVTDPSKPVYLYHLPGQEGLGESGAAQMTRVCSGAQLPKGDKNTIYLLRTFGNIAHEIWNVTDPATPKLVSRIEGELKDTHKSWWECDTGIAYLVSGAPGWRTRRMTQVYDLSDPAHPVKIRDFGLPGQQPGSSGSVPTELHGPISAGPDSNRVYFGYGTNKGGIIQIVDRKKLLEGPSEPTPENLKAPEISQLALSPLIGAHTVLPLLKMPIPEFKNDKDGSTRDMLMIVDESLVNECAEARQMVWFADITVETRPMVVSNFTVDEGSGDFCQRGGRFGSHSSNEAAFAIFNKKVVFVTFFNAGVRAIDIRDPFRPKEIGYFIPAITAATTQRCVKINGADRCKTAIQSNNVEIDDRGYVYVVDRANTGVHILKLSDETLKSIGQ